MPDGWYTDQTRLAGITRAGIGNTLPIGVGREARRAGLTVLTRIAGLAFALSIEALAMRCAVQQATAIYRRVETGILKLAAASPDASSVFTRATAPR